MASDGPGLVLKQPVSVWNRKLGVGFRDFFRNLGKAAVSAKTGRFDRALASTIDAAAAVRLEDPTPGEVAWVLIRRALEQATIQLVAESREHLFPGDHEIGELSDEVIASLEETELEIDLRFFRDPASLEIVEPIAEAFRLWLIGAGAEEEIAGSVSGRLPRYFVDQLHTEWVDDPSRYAKVEAFLEDSPFAEAAGRERAWVRYDAWLQKQIDEPLLGEPFSLRQTYVPLRAYWEEVREVDGNRHGLVETEVFRHVVELDDDLDGWASHPDPDKAIRLLSGGPGSGKSSAGKMFAARMSGRSDLRVVWIPLHRLSFEKKLERALDDFCDGPRTPPKNLFSEHRGLLLIFDGLDELALAGRASREHAKAFVAEVLQLTQKYNLGDEIQVQVLLSGREVAIQDYAEALRRSRTLILLGHAPHPENRESFEPQDRLEEDRRGNWWARYREVTGRGPGELPVKLSDEKLRDLTSQPLLNVLVALVWGDENGAKELDLTTEWARNDLYRTLLGLVYERKWGGQHAAQHALSKEEYIRVLEEIAVAAWHSGEARRVSRKEIEERCADAHLSESLKKFSDDAGEGVTQLLTAFYFRRTAHFDAEGEMTFEFTHKSFAEYLVARRISALIETCSSLLQQYKQNADIPGSPRDLLVTWSRLLGPKPLEENLAELTWGEIVRHDDAVARRWHTALVALLEETVHHGYPMEQIGLASFMEMREQACNAEESLAVCRAAAGALTEGRLTVDWGDRGIKAWIQSIQAESRSRGLQLLRRGLMNLELQNENLSGLILIGAQMPGANLESANLAETNLASANLDGANLYGANLDGTKLRDAVLMGANLERSSLYDANLRAALLENANLDSAMLVRVNLYQANLEAAILDGANLYSANCDDADFSKTILHNAKFKDANLYRASLNSADLRGANLTRANLYRANLEGADFFGAALNDALFEFVSFNEHTTVSRTQGDPRNCPPELLERIHAG